MITERIALFMCATHCQGGHSEAGAAAAKVLGIPFPITMSNLIAKARDEGHDPRQLWPWFYKTSERHTSAPLPHDGESP